eukprot:g6621.t1
MQKPRRRATFALLCYLGVTATTSSTCSTLVSGFHTMTPGGRTRGRRLAGGAPRSPPRQVQQPQSLKASAGGSVAMGAVGMQQHQQQHREGGRGWRRGLGAVDASISGSGSGSGGDFMRRVVHDGGKRFVFRRAARGGASAPSRLLRYAAAGGGDDDDENYGSPDYSEFGYEPEYELQEEDKFDADAETLAKWRLEKLLANDRWQFGKYGTQNVGNWIGSWQEFVAQEVTAGRGEDEDEDSSFGSMIGMVPGKKFVANTKITRRVIEPADDTRIFEHEQGPAAGGEGQGAVGYDSDACPRPVVDILFTDSFRGGNGTQVVGNAYTAADVHRSAAVAGGSADDRDVWIEIGLRAREKGVRMRCVFQYGPKGGEGEEGGGSREKGDGKERAPSPSATASGSAWSMVIRRLFLVREGLDRLPPEDAAMEPELYGTAGKGLYDPSPLSRSPLYFSIYAEGGLTLRFPLEVEAGQGGVFSVDWTEGSSRYQADRVFNALDGTVLRLEVTEIGTEDAEDDSQISGRQASTEKQELEDGEGKDRCAPGFEGAGDGGGLGHGGGGPFPPIERQRPRDFSGKSSREEHHHIHRSREGKARRVRRLPLSVFTDYPPSFTSSRAQQVERRTDNHATLGIATTASEFAWFVLVHGCLCEAPLAVIEGLVRGPLYLAAAAWTSIVSLIGSPSHVEQRAELSQHAAALAREGVLFLVAAITLAVPFSTSFTVYGEAMERSDDWDVRTVPTFLGAVDPLRFFVFAFGQAGELAANGRPEPLRHLRDNSQLSQWTVATSSTAADGGRREMPDACFDGSAHFSPPASYVGVIAAQSMDTDQLGVGILHPPQEIRLRFSRVGAAARRAAVSAYRGLATRMASVYRRLPHYGVVMARITGRFSNSIAGAGHSAATRKTDQGACVV